MEMDPTVQNDRCWRGIPMEEIYRGFSEWELNHLPPIVNRRNHTVLFELPLNANGTEPPRPHNGQMKWDSLHVRLPCSPQNEYIVSDENDESVTVKKQRWEIIQNALLQPILTSRDLEKAILSYNTKYAKQWKFHALHELFEEELDEVEATAFFTETLPEIIRLALRLPDLIPSAIPLLKHGTSKSISLSQEQIASLLANAFLCTFPRRNEHNRKSEYRNFPSINFNSLYQTRYGGEQVIEKIKCICFYFRSVCKKMPVGTVTFARRTKSMNDFPDWNECDAAFGGSSLVHVSSDGTIEDNGNGLLQVDFANKYIGGGVLNTGCVQEEIRFVVYPELLCSRLFTEQLDLNEAVLILGCERFNSYSGYASTFKWTGGCVDETPFDSSRRRRCCVVAIDAIYFRDQSHQYQEELMKRELNKAFVGFYHELSSPAPAVATGNWGCGAFNGDKSLKALLQLMVCCVTNRPLVYYTFGDVQLRDDFYDIFKYLTRNSIKIRELWSYLKQFRRHKLPAEHLYPFIMQCHQDVGRNRVERSSTIIETPKSCVIHSSTAANGDRNEATTWPSSDDDDEASIAVQIHAIENDHFQQNASERRASPNLVKRKQSTSRADDPPQQTSLETVRPESKEKRHRSLLDCLDQNYFVASPNKIKREAIVSVIGTDASATSDANVAKHSTDCCIDIDSESVAVKSTMTEANHTIQKLHIDDETNETIQSQTDKLQTLHVVSDPGSDTASSSPDTIASSPPSTEPYYGPPRTQRSLLDFFKAK